MIRTWLIALPAATLIVKNEALFATLEQAGHRENDGLGIVPTAVGVPLAGLSGVSDSGMYKRRPSRRSAGGTEPVPAGGGRDTGAGQQQGGRRQSGTVGDASGDGTGRAEAGSSRLREQPAGSRQDWPSDDDAAANSGDEIIDGAEAGRRQDGHSRDDAAAGSGAGAEETDGAKAADSTSMEGLLGFCELWLHKYNGETTLSQVDGQGTPNRAQRKAALRLAGLDPRHPGPPTPAVEL